MLSQLKPYLVGLILSLSFLILGLITISDYGISWDAQFRMMRGQANLNFYMTGRDQFNLPKHLPPVLIKPGEEITKYHYNSFELENNPKHLSSLPPRPLPQAENTRLTFYQDDIWSKYFIHNEDFGHLALIDILAALSNKIFFQNLHVLGDIESYQLVYLISCAIGVFVVFAFTYQITKSQVASTIAGLSLALYPLFLGDSHINLKDPILASFFAGAVWAFWNWIRVNKLGWFVVFCIFTFCALGVKWNVVLLPGTLFPWLLTIFKTPEFKQWFKIKRLALLTLAGGTSIFFFLVLITQSSWSDPLGRFLGIFNFYVGNVTGNNSLQPDGFIGPFGFNFYPVFLFFTQTPEIILIFVFAGLFSLKNFKSDYLKTTVLISLWALEPLIRLFLPNIRSLLGLRQAMEFIPGLAILAGLGSFYLIKSLKFLKYPKSLLLLLVTCILLLFPVWKYHPNQNAYFNNLTGGLAGASDSGFTDWTLTYGNVYKQAANWLNQNAEKEANIGLVDGAGFGLSPLWLRSDISISPFHFSGLNQSGEYLLMLNDHEDIPIFAYLYQKRFLNPVYEIKSNGATLLTIYKNSPENVKDEFKKQKNVLADAKLNQTQADGQYYLDIDLGKPQRITKLVISGADSKCISRKINDLFVFQTLNEVLYKGNDPHLLYAFNQTRVLEDGKIEFSFPAQQSNEIVILPANRTSCFETGRVSEIDVLE